MIPLVVAAALIRLTWTKPDSGDVGISAYECRRGNAEQGWVPANIYRSPALDPVVPKPGAAVRETAYVAQSTDPNSAFGWRHGGAAYQVRAVNVFGDTATWSNVVTVATALPDTNVTDGGRTWKRPASGVVTFARAPGDDAMRGGPIFTQEAYAAVTRDVVCALIGYWCLAGLRMTCGLQP